jgi:hypothetical protein
MLEWPIKPARNAKPPQLPAFGAHVDRSGQDTRCLDLDKLADARPSHRKEADGKTQKQLAVPLQTTFEALAASLADLVLKKKLLLSLGKPRFKRLSANFVEMPALLNGEDFVAAQIFLAKAFPLAAASTKREQARIDGVRGEA